MKCTKLLIWINVAYSLRIIQRVLPTPASNVIRGPHFKNDYLSFYTKEGIYNYHIRAKEFTYKPQKGIVSFQDSSTYTTFSEDSHYLWLDKKCVEISQPLSLHRTQSSTHLVTLNNHLYFTDGSTVSKRFLSCSQVVCSASCGNLLIFGTLNNSVLIYDVSKDSFIFQQENVVLNDQVISIGCGHYADTLKIMVGTGKGCLIGLSVRYSSHTCDLKEKETHKLCSSSINHISVSRDLVFASTNEAVIVSDLQRSKYVLTDPGTSIIDSLRIIKKEKSWLILPSGTRRDILIYEVFH